MYRKMDAVREFFLIVACIALICCQRRPEDRRIVCVAASKSGKWIAAGTAAGRIAVWDIGNPGRPVLAKEDDGVLNEFRFSRDEQWLAIAGRNLTVRPPAQFDKPRTLRGDGRNYGSAQFSPVADTILTIDGKGAIEILDAKSGRAIASACCSTIGGAVAFTPDGARFIGAGHLPRMWDARTGALVARMSRERQFMTLGPIAFRGDQVLMGSQDGGIYIWNWRTGRIAGTSPSTSDWVDTIAVQ